MAKLRLMLDANILLDVLTRREPFYTASAKIWAAIETSQIEGCVAAHSITTIFYILSRHISKENALSAIGDIMRIFTIAEINQLVIQQALILGWDDLEDAVQVCSAINYGVDYFITRDKFKLIDDLLTIMSPDDFLTMLPLLKSK